MRCICAKKNSDIPLGRTGENDVEGVSFDVKDWPSLYGEGGSFVLVHQRPGDTQPYVCATAVGSSGNLVWVIQDTDVQFTGRGEAQLSYVVDSKVAKSVIFTTRISRSLDQEGELPEPYESMIEDLIEAAANITTEANRAEAAAQNAAQSESNADTFQRSAAQSAVNAQLSAQAAATARGKAEAAQTAAETAQGKAETAQTAAETAQGKAETAQTAAEAAQGRAEAAQNAVENMTVSTETLPPGSYATAEKTVDQETGLVNIAFGLPQGEKGEQGDDYTLTAQDREDIAELVKDDTDIFQDSTGQDIEEILNTIRGYVQIISNFVEYTGDTELSDESTMWVQNRVLKAAIDTINTALSGKQATLTFDNVPTQNSSNPVKSGGVFSALNDIITALSGKQATLTFDNTPTENSSNPVKSGGVYSADKAMDDAIKAGTEATADYHLGFYLDENGDLIQVDDE